MFLVRRKDADGSGKDLSKSGSLRKRLAKVSPLGDAGVHDAFFLGDVEDASSRDIGCTGAKIDLRTRVRLLATNFLVLANTWPITVPGASGRSSLTVRVRFLAPGGVCVSGAKIGR